MGNLQKFVLLVVLLITVSGANNAWGRFVEGKTVGNSSSDYSKTQYQMGSESWAVDFSVNFPDPRKVSQKKKAAKASVDMTIQHKIARGSNMSWKHRFDWAQVYDHFFWTPKSSNDAYLGVVFLHGANNYRVYVFNLRAQSSKGRLILNRFSDEIPAKSEIQDGTKLRLQLYEEAKADGGKPQPVTVVLPSS